MGLERQEAEARLRRGGARAPVAGVLEKGLGVGSRAMTGLASGGVGVCDSGAVWVSGGEVTGGRCLLAAPLRALKGPAPSPSVLFLLWFRSAEGFGG